MAKYDISKLHPVFVRQMEALAALDIEAVMKNYTDDAVLLRFEGSRWASKPFARRSPAISR